MNIFFGKIVKLLIEGARCRVETNSNDVLFGC